MAFDWHVGWWSEQAALGGPATTILELITQEELSTLYEHDVIVERVIGQYWIRPVLTLPPDPPVLLHARLTVRQVDPEATVFAMPIWAFSQAEERFMWHKVHLFDQGEANWPSSSMHPAWSHLDVKVNRRLSDLESLAFIMDASGAWNGTSPVYDYGAWIRVLVKT